MSITERIRPTGNPQLALMLAVELSGQAKSPYTSTQQIRDWADGFLRWLNEHDHG